MKISEILDEQQLTPQQQIAKDAELIAQHQRQQWLKQQQSQQQPQQPTVAPAAPEIKVTPDMIAKHPQYKAWYDKYLAIELPRSTHRGAAEIQAKKYADGKITRLIQQGQ